MPKRTHTHKLTHTHTHRHTHTHTHTAKTIDLLNRNNVARSSLYNFHKVESVKDPLPRNVSSATTRLAHKTLSKLSNDKLGGAERSPSQRGLREDRPLLTPFLPRDGRARCDA